MEKVQRGGRRLEKGEVKGGKRLVKGGVRGEKKI